MKWQFVSLGYVNVLFLNDRRTSVDTLPMMLVVVDYSYSNVFMVSYVPCRKLLLNDTPTKEDLEGIDFSLVRSTDMLRNITGTHSRYFYLLLHHSGLVVICHLQ